MNATKSMIGHSLGAAGGLEAVSIIKAIQVGRSLVEESRQSVSYWKLLNTLSHNSHHGIIVRADWLAPSDNQRWRPRRRGYNRYLHQRKSWTQSKLKSHCVNKDSSKQRISCWLIRKPLLPCTDKGGNIKLVRIRWAQFRHSVCPVWTIKYSGTIHRRSATIQIFEVSIALQQVVYLRIALHRLSIRG